MVIVAGGTGLFPFLDILNFLLMKTLYTITRARWGDAAANKLNPQSIQFDRYFEKGFKVILILTVPSKKDLV